MLASSDDEMRLYEEWANKYGRVYRVPGPLGSSRIVLCDPKAVASFYSKETFTYVRSALGRIFIRTFFGGGLLSTEGETHRRQRKALAPAFSNAAIRELTDVFFDLAHKCKSIWDDILDSHPEGVVIDVQRWMSNITLDSIGIAGFSHNFGQLDGKDSDVAVAFDSFGDSRNVFTMFILLLSHYLPFLAALPTKHNRAIRRLRKSLSDISYELLEQTGKESQGGVEEMSIVGLLIKAQEGAALALKHEEVMSQLNVILFAGYETTSTSLTWALIELCRFPEKQQKLRDELLSEFRSSDPTWDQLMTAIPYLDAVVHETLRMHPPIVMTTRKAAKDDVIPLSAPIVTSNGQMVSSISIAKGTTVSVPIHLMHQAEWFWGSDAKEFYPERWLEPSFGEKNEVQGHRHLLSFLDGPRTCLGKNFALAELKAVLSVLVRNFIFEFDGPEPKIEEYVSILPRPKFAGEDGAKVPLRVRRVE
ncbi:Cytochrome P450 superfamily protein [Pleurotus pulmonarius]